MIMGETDANGRIIQFSGFNIMSFSSILWWIYDTQLGGVDMPEFSNKKVRLVKISGWFWWQWG